MTKESNLDVFQNRKEIKELKNGSGNYINLRTTNDIHLLENIILELKSKGPDYVLASWISPPFGIIIGYGVYSNIEATQLAKRSEQEHWGFPKFGSIYDQERLDRRIARIRGE